MEGLAGTAIRSAVRDLSCPQGPGPDWSSTAPAVVRGPSCGWLRPRPPCRRGTGFPGIPGRRVASRAVMTPAGTGTPVSSRGSSPGSTVRVTRCQPAPPPRPGTCRISNKVPGIPG